MTDSKKDGVASVLETYEDLIELARIGAQERCWCPFCKCAIRNGDVVHSMDCLLYLAEDEE